METEEKLIDMRHLFLYAKFWYERKTLVEDLKVIFGKYSGIEPKYIGKETIIMNLTEVVGTIWKNKYPDPSTSLRHLLTHIIDYSEHGSDQFDAMIIALLNEFHVTVDEIKKYFGGILGDPDPDVLPLSDSAIKTIENRNIIK